MYVFPVFCYKFDSDALPINWVIFTELMLINIVPFQNSVCGGIILFIVSNVNILGSIRVFLD